MDSTATYVPFINLKFTEVHALQNYQHVCKLSNPVSYIILYNLIYLIILGF